MTTATTTAPNTAGPLPAGRPLHPDLGRLPRRREPRHVPRVPRGPKYLDDFDAWRGEYANPFRDLQGDGRSRNWDDERRIRDQEADGGVVAEVDLPEHGAAVLPDRDAASPARRRPTSTSTASPASAPTTAGSPTSAPSTRSAAPASARSSSTTSTTRSPTCTGSRSTVCAAGSCCRRCRPTYPAHRPAVLARLRPAVGGLRGARRRRQPATPGTGTPDYGRSPLAASCG